VVGEVRTKNTTADYYIGNIDVSTTPTTGATKLLMSLTYTAASTSNILVFKFTAPFGINSTTRPVGFFIFNGSTCLYSQASVDGTATQIGSISINFYMNPASTSSTTYDIRYVSVAPSSFTAYVNQDASGNNFGGTFASTFQITEVKP
jgi:hypothetical protein